MKIETKRLILIPISLKYADDIFNEFTPEIAKYMTPKPAETIKETKQMIEKSLEGLKNGTNLQMVIINTSSRKIPESHNGKIVREYSKVGEGGNELHFLEYWIYT